ncbi:uncharacterized protein [Diadema antillarum]|uniref:uncharacterized protein n=1 Tax=Diadema antillarum TaxID=105358 RepID=UPI003A8A1F32
MSYIAVLIFNPVSATSAPSTNLSEDELSLHMCARDCTQQRSSRLCAFEFTAEWYYSMSKACYRCPFNSTDCERPHCIALNGVQRPVLSINRQIPGPSIQVCQGDRIQVKVHNLLDNSEGLAIHWHGQHQRHSPHMDGTSMITQCPIPHPQTFTYDFVAETPGTHWWHSHSGLQRADGIFGSLVVRQAKDVDEHGDLYDVDRVDHVLVLSDWTDVMAMQHMMMDLHADGPGEPDGLLINGRGAGQVFEQDGLKTELQRRVFSVTPGLRHRFRTINTAVTNCPLILSVAGHTITVIASDGSPFDPISVSGFVISGGERYDFVFAADKPIDNYWLRVRGVEGSECEGIEQLAILRYNGAPIEEPTGELDDEVQNGVILNLPNHERMSSSGPGLVDLRGLNISPEVVRKDPDVRHYIEVDSVYRNSPKLHHPLYYPVEKGGQNGATYTAKRTHMLNNISFALPPVPVLSHHDLVPDDELCTMELLLATTGRDCGKEYCSCIHVIEVKLGQVVELILVTKSQREFEPHPLHLHGNHFYVIAYDNGDQVPLEQVKEMNERGELEKNLERPLRKDTIMMAQRFVILRLRADNPGWWLCHCHMDLHQELGMAVILRVGDDADLPLPPDNLPVCARDGYSYKTKPKEESPGNQNDAPMGPSDCDVFCATPVASSVTRTALYLSAMATGVLMTLATIFIVASCRKYRSRNSRVKYKRLSNGNFEMALIDG